MLAPQKIPDNFTFRGKLFHLTYAEHIAPDVLLNTARRATSTPLLGYSIAHEDTSEYGDEGQQLSAGYEHTHFAMIFSAKVMLKGSRKFDAFISDATDPLGVRQIHPNVQPTISMAQMEQIFTYYHAGRKYSIETGKTSFKPPILHVYHLPANFDFNRALMEDVVAAESLFEACVAGQVRPRSVTDVKALRAEQKPTKAFKHKYPATSFSLCAPPTWQVLHIHGGTGLGKTKWAVAQFSNPCVIKPFDSVGCLESLEKNYDPERHDGLVLDEVNLSFLSRQQVIALFDPDEDCTLDVRFKSFTLPAGVKKILVSNEAPAQLYPLDPHGAIARRFIVLHITAPTYGGTPAPVLPPPTPLQPLQPNQLTPPTQPAHGV